MHVLADFQRKFTKSLFLEKFYHQINLDGTQLAALRCVRD